VTSPIEKHVALWLGLSNKKALEKTEGLAKALTPGKLSIFRLTTIPELPEDVQQFTPPTWASKSKALGHAWITIASLWHALKLKPDLCMSISLYPHAIIARIAALISRSRFGIWFIGSDQYRHLMHPMASRIISPAIKRADVVMCMGEHSRDHLVDQGFPFDRIFIGRNAYRLDEYAPRDNQATSWDIIYTGRMDLAPKNLPLFLESISRTTQNIPNLKVIMVGDGPAMPWLRNEVERRRLKAHVTLAGYSNNVQEYLRQSRVLLMTSAWEGLPASIVEAFACGLPVISTNVGDISTLCTHGHNSLLSERHSSIEIANLLSQVITDQHLFRHLRQGAIQTGQAFRERSIITSTDAWKSALSMIKPRCVIEGTES
jgi:glycosyltransferase involved in cell wall biosynthesis